MTKELLQLSEQLPVHQRQAQAFVERVLDIMAIFTDAVQAMSVVPKVAKAGITPTSIEYMDNPNVRTTSQFLEFPGAPHIENGIYVIFTIETFTEDELDMKMEQLNDICEECGAIEVLEADDRIWLCAVIAWNPCAW